MHPSNIIKGLKKYFECSNIHGFKYIVKKDHHWSERILWIILCTLSWYACIMTLLNIYRNFVDNPVAITIDTSYLDWISPFPTIAICSSFNQAAKEYAAVNGTMNARTLSEQLFLPSRMGYLKRLERLKIPAEEYVAMYNQVKPNCSKTFAKCEWNGKSFDCCNEFVTLHTTIGYCQMLNSKHAQSVKSTLDFSVNRTHKYAYLAFDFTDEYKKTNGDIQIYFLNNVEIPTISTSNNKILKNIENVVGIDFNVLDIINEDGVKNTPPDKRECRFPEENKDTLIYDLYSFDGCTTDNDVIKMLQVCGCISYSYPRKSDLQACDMKGMKCIIDYRRESTTNNNDQVCLPDCEGASINWYMYTYDELEGNNSSSSSGLRMRMLSTPHMRYQRYVTRSFIDVLVAGGSSMGLFTGASILSIIELIYWLFFRIYRYT